MLEEDLRREYLINNKTLKSISEEYNIPKQRLRYLLYKYHILKDIAKSKTIHSVKEKKTDKTLLINNKEALYQAYITENKTRKEIASICNVSEALVCKRIIQFNIHKPLDLIITNTVRSNLPIRKEMQKATQKTMLRRYGVKSYLQTEECKVKSKATCLRKYGVENVAQSEKVKIKHIETCKRKYGTSYLSQNELIKQKIVNTCIERYGKPYVFQVPTIREKIKQTNLRRYGTDNVLKLEATHLKRYATLTQNKTWITSKHEEEINELLCQKFTDVKRQYHTEKYPFNCDFYIPSLDLYIEYQGTWSHGDRPYDKYSEYCQSILHKWQTRSKELNRHSRYDDAIDVWTRRDPIKREVAKKNNLNWIEFFNMNQFKEWYNNLD